MRGCPAKPMGQAVGVVMGHSSYVLLCGKDPGDHGGDNTGSPSVKHAIDLVAGKYVGVRLGRVQHCV